jgi:ribosomal protein S25
MECRHLNGDAKNNRVENLRWGTKQENIDDRVSHGHNRDQNGAKNNMAVLDESIVLEIRRCYAAGEFVSQRQIAEHYNVSPALICNILKRKIWTHI